MPRSEKLNTISAEGILLVLYLIIEGESSSVNFNLQQQCRKPLSPTNWTFKTYASCTFSSPFARRPLPPTPALPSSLHKCGCCFCSHISVNSSIGLLVLTDNLNKVEGGWNVHTQACTLTIYWKYNHIYRQVHTGTPTQWARAVESIQLRSNIFLCMHIAWTKRSCTEPFVQHIQKQLWLLKLSLICGFISSHHSQKIKIKHGFHAFIFLHELMVQHNVVIFKSYQS